MHTRHLMAKSLVAVAALFGLGIGTASAGPGTALTLKAPARIVAGQTVTLRGRLTKGGAAVAGQRLEVQNQIVGGPWKTNRMITTNAAGKVVAALMPAGDTAYRLRNPVAQAGVRKVTSATRRVTVVLSIKAHLRHPNPPFGGHAYVVGQVFPGRPYPLRFQELLGHHWKTIITDPRERPKFSIKIVADARGKFHYRVLVGPTQFNARAFSRSFLVTVH
jgi:hypothetical protein